MDLILIAFMKNNDLIYKNVLNNAIVNKLILPFENLLKYF